MFALEILKVSMVGGGGGGEKDRTITAKYWPTHGANSSFSACCIAISIQLYKMGFSLFKTVPKNPFRQI